MRLTLRTLLAWLDGVLDADEQRLLGDRVASSTVATGLTQRILLSVARPDHGAAGLEAWGTPDDLNVVADYLDNRLLPDQVEWFERSCMQSELRLAEIADCHGALADLWRIGDDRDVAKSASMPTRDRLKQLVHRSVADGARGATGSSVRQVNESACDAAAAPGLTAQQGPSVIQSAGVAAGSKAALASPPATRLSPRHEVAKEKAGWYLPARGASEPSSSGRNRSGVTAGRKSSDRLPAAVAVAVLLAFGGGVVAWLNFGGRGSDPRRASIEGSVTFDGAPLENGVMLLLPSGETKGPSAGSSVSKGAFSIAAAAGPVVGRYRVEIKARRRTGRKVKPVAAVGGPSETDEMEQFIPAKYNTDSEIEIDIKPGRNRITLELQPEPQPQGKPGAASKTPRVVTGHEKSPPAKASAALRPPRIPG